MTLRITGLASGLDTESIIAMLVNVRKQPITKLETKVADDETKVAAYTELQTLATKVQSAAYNLSMPSTWSARTATSTDESVVTATASDGTATGSFSVVASAIAKAERNASDGVATSASSTGSFTVNGKTVNVTAGDSLSTIAAAINNASAGVKATVVSNTLLIESNTTGKANGITYTDGSSILKDLGVVDASAQAITTNDGYQASDDAVAYVNGVKVTSASNSITTAVSGVTFKLADLGSSTVTVGNNTSSIKTMVQDLLDAYNELYSYIESSTAVSRNSSNEATSAGILQGQMLPNNIESSLFQLMSATIDNPGVSSSVNSLYKIGVRSSDNSAGNYEISDESAFDSALKDHFDDVKNLFRGSNTDGYYGIAKKMDTYLHDTVLNKIDGSLSTQLSDLNSDITNSNSRISTLESQLTLYETNLYNHFASMETNVNSVNSSLQYLLGALGLSSN